MACQSPDQDAPKEGTGIPCPINYFIKSFVIKNEIKQKLKEPFLDFYILNDTLPNIDSVTL
jgi:hypothetical protein